MISIWISNLNAFREFSVSARKFKAAQKTVAEKHKYRVGMPTNRPYVGQIPIVRCLFTLPPSQPIPQQVFSLSLYVCVCMCMSFKPKTSNLKPFRYTPCSAHLLGAGLLRIRRGIQLSEPVLDLIDLTATAEYGNIWNICHCIPYSHCSAALYQSVTQQLSAR